MYANPHQIRAKFCREMSKMYQSEVPLYGDLIRLVEDTNDICLQDDDLRAQLATTEQMDRLSEERHGAIRLGTPDELATMRRLFAVMAMHPVGYYDLAPSGVPVHSTAFRPIDKEGLAISPFRVFTSLLRMDLLDDDLRTQAQQALAKRDIFTPRVRELIDIFEQNGGLTQAQADEFIAEALYTFKWHKDAAIDKKLYDALGDKHKLIADVVGFKGPHINHLTPRTLDIDSVQANMVQRGLPAKEIVEGPPARNCPILLRQTSFKALTEKVNFAGEEGAHTARFGEIEQRGAALTPKGRALYDKLLAKAKAGLTTTPEKDPDSYYQALRASFVDFVDDWRSLHDDDLAYFYYSAHPQKLAPNADTRDIKALLDSGALSIAPIVYEDFLPASAAGIFQSNLGDNAKNDHADAVSSQVEFEHALGKSVLDENALYATLSQQSLDDSLKTLAA